MFFIFMAVSPSKNGAMEYMLNCTSPPFLKIPWADYSQQVPGLDPSKV